MLRDHAAGRWLRFRRPVAVLEAREPKDVAAVVGEMQARVVAGGLHAIGFLCYEAASGLNPDLVTHAPGWLPVCWFALFEEPLAGGPTGMVSTVPPLEWTASDSKHDYCARVRRIKGLLASGDSYQVNYTYRLRAALNEALATDPFPLFAGMLARQSKGYGAYLNTDRWSVCCASHELFFYREGRQLTSRPMKGTAPRGNTPADDERLASWLRDSSKNRAENLMITDMVRNDLGRIADIGSVQTSNLFALERYPTLWQMTSTVTATSDASLLGVLRALFPAASITGAPKRRTMEIIRDLESAPRQLYTGTIGYLRPDGRAQFNVAIRTAIVDKVRRFAEYGVGGGIVWDSDPAEEYRECLTKTRVIRNQEPDFCLLETLLWRPDGGYVRLDAHLARLQRAADAFQREMVQQQIRRQLDELASGLRPLPHRVRLLVDADGAATVSAVPLTDLPSPYRLALAVSAQPVIDNPYVANKTTHRTLYDAALRDVRGADDVLLWNERAELTESTIANLFVERDGVLLTPPASSGLLPGVFRQEMLESGGAREALLTIDDLGDVQAVYLGNSLRGLWPVEVLVPRPGPL